MFEASARSGAWCLPRSDKCISAVTSRNTVRGKKGPGAGCRCVSGRRVRFARCDPAAMVHVEQREHGAGHEDREKQERRRPPLERHCRHPSMGGIETTGAATPGVHAISGRARAQSGHLASVLVDDDHAEQSKTTPPLATNADNTAGTGEAATRSTTSKCIKGQPRSPRAASSRCRCAVRIRPASCCAARSISSFEGFG